MGFPTLYPLPSSKSHQVLAQMAPSQRVLPRNFYLKQDPLTSHPWSYSTLFLSVIFIRVWLFCLLIMFILIEYKFHILWKKRLASFVISCIPDSILVTNYYVWGGSRFPLIPASISLDSSWVSYNFNSIFYFFLNKVCLFVFFSF